MFTVKVIDAQKQRFLSGEQLVLTIQVLEDGKKVEVRKHGFPLELTEKELQAELEKFVETYNSDADLAEADKVKEEQNKKTDAIIKKLVGKEIK